MPEKEQLVKQIRRVLKKNGRLLLLTPNGNFLRYRFMAPFFRIDTRHLSSDKFVTSEWIENIFQASELTKFRIGFWTFIPHQTSNWLLLSPQRFNKTTQPIMVKITRLLAVVLLLCPSQHLFAQQSATIRGTVTDDLNNFVENAKVIIKEY